MKVEIRRLGGGPVKFEDFADAHGLVMEVVERGEGRRFGAARFYAHFKDSETKRGKGDPFLAGTSGDGDTVEAAIEHYKRELEGKLLVIDASGGERRREIQCPSEWEETK